MGKDINDGNKCCGAFSFIWLLKRAGFNVEKFINPNALTALTLLIAESNSNDIFLLLNQFSHFFDYFLINIT